MYVLDVDIFSHFFKVTKISARARPAVLDFVRKCIHYAPQRQPGGSYTKSMKAVFAARTEDYSEYRFHRNHYASFLEVLRQHHISEAQLNVKWQKIPTPHKTKFKMRKEFTDREHQVEAIQYSSNPDGPASRIVQLQTGKGKGYVFMRSLVEWGVFPIMVLRAQFIEKWVIELQEKMELGPEDVMVVRGANQLMALLELATGKKKHDYKIALVTNKTIQNWLKLYEHYKEDTLEMGYACLPEDFYKHMGAGIRGIDEVHNDFHLNFKMDLYTNVRLVSSMSATFVSDDPFITRMYEVAYPIQDRLAKTAYDRYIHAKAISYCLYEPQRIRFIDPMSKNYSHHKFEESITNVPGTAANFFRLVDKCIKESYLKEYIKGQKLLIFCASIQFSTYLTNYLRKTMPGFNVQRYVEEDPYENLISEDVDITVSTVQSAGVGHDIPNLTTVIMTNSLNSSQGNIQGMGRLRKIPGVKLFFLYFVCADIEKQVQYHEKKREILKDRALDYSIEYMAERV